MRKGFHKLFMPKTKWNFRKADLTESTKELRNPARGWYQIYTFWADKKPDFRELFWCGTDDDTLAMIIINISAYREKMLDEEALEHIRDILRFFTDTGYNLVLRIAYDHEGKALEREPFFFAQVKEHLEQLMPVLNEYSRSIFVFQGMLIGNWGEMHTSRFLASAKLKEMWSIMKEASKDTIFFAVRRPAHWRVLHPEGCGRVELPYDNMGLFDDAIFGSENHLGTFGKGSKESSGWDNLWCRKDELEFEQKLCLRVPNGGEAICGEDYNGNVSETVDTLRKMHITYLNKYYDKKLLNLWNDMRWEGAGVWQGSSLFDYIGKHLGYRFWIKDVNITLDEERYFIITISIENVGFANFYQEAEVYLEWIDEATGLERIRKISCDMRDWDSGSVQTISYKMEAINCILYLSAKRKTDGKKIFFANQPGNNGRYFLGQISDLRLR